MAGGSIAALARATGAAVLLVACGRTELLPAPLTDAGRGGDAGVGGGAGGAAGAAGGGFAGTLVSVGGAPTVGEPEGGRLVQHAELLAKEVMLTALASAADGRVAVGGSFEGQLDFGGQVLSSARTPGVPFVATYDAAGKLLWARQLTSWPELISGLAFAPDGTLVVHSSDNDIAADAKDSVHARKLDLFGETLWETKYGSFSVGSGKVVVDAAGQIWLAGTAFARASFGAQQLGHDPSTAYLFQLGPNGATGHAEEVQGDGCVDSALTDLALDREQNLIVSALCRDAGGARSAFVRKRTRSGERLYEKHFTGSLSFNLGGVFVASDGEGRLATGGAFTSSFDLDGVLVNGAGDASANAWLASFSSAGALLKRSVFGTYRDGVLALVNDRSDNLTVLAGCDGLHFGARDLTPNPERRGALCVLKLDPEGELLWARLLEGWAQPTAITSDAGGYTWVAAQYGRDVWFGDLRLPGNDTSGGLLLRLSP